MPVPMPAPNHAPVPVLVPDVPVLMPDPVPVLVEVVAVEAGLDVAACGTEAHRQRQNEHVGQRRARFKVEAGQVRGAVP